MLWMNAQPLWYSCVFPAVRIPHVGKVSSFSVFGRKALKIIRRLRPQMSLPGRAITVALAAVAGLSLGAEAYPVAVILRRMLRQQERPAGSFRSVRGVNWNFARQHHRHLWWAAALQPIFLEVFTSFIRARGLPPLPNRPKMMESLVMNQSVNVMKDLRLHRFVSFHFPSRESRLNGLLFDWIATG